MTPALSWLLLHTTVTCLRIRKQLELQFGNIVSGVFTPVLAKHTKHVSLVDILSVGIDRMQRNFEPMRKQVEAWKRTRLSDENAKLIIYRAFIERELEAPKHLVRWVHDHYFNPQVEEFAPRTLWSLPKQINLDLIELLQPFRPSQSFPGT